MPQQPSRRDSATPIAVIRHHQSYARGLDPGYIDGRYATPQLVLPGPSQNVGGDEGGEGADDVDPLWEDGDRYTVTGPGPQTWLLSKEPLEESLQVTLHPQGRGGLIVVQPEWSVFERTVTIPDDDDLLLAGDEFSAHYQYLEGEDGEPAAVMRTHAGAGSSVDNKDLVLPIPHDPGELEVDDLMLLFVARDPTIATPSGWTRYGAVTDGVIHLFYRISDGTETSVTLSTPGFPTSTGHAAELVVVAGGDLDNLTVTRSTQNPATGAFTPMIVGDGAVNLTLAILDGPGSPPDEYIASTSGGTLLENQNLGPNVWGFAIVSGSGTFTPSNTSGPEYWQGIGVNL